MLLATYPRISVSKLCLGLHVWYGEKKKLPVITVSRLCHHLSCHIPFSSSIPGDVYSPLELKMKQNGTVTITVITRSRGSHCYGQQT